MYCFFKEQQNSTWQSKYKKAAVELEDAEERCEAAEAALQKARQRARGASGTTTRGVSAPKFLKKCSRYFLQQNIILESAKLDVSRCKRTRNHAF